MTVGMPCTIWVADVTVGVEMVYAKLAGPADVSRSICGIDEKKVGRKLQQSICSSAMGDSGHLCRTSITSGFEREIRIRLLSFLLEIGRSVERPEATN
jgi:hypothetical protein